MPDNSRRAAVERDDPFHVMTMPNGPACNLECEYCYYLEKTELYPGETNVQMTEETLERFVKQYIEAQPGPQVTFAWQGGEPTLRGLDFYREAVRYQREYVPPDKQVVNTLQTNGTRLDDEWCQFLAANDFLVGISIDGPRDLHDRYRKTRADGPTFDEVTNGLSLLQKHDVEYNVLCVVNSYNSQHPLRLYEFFKEQGIEWLQFVPLVERATEADPVSTGSESPDVGSDPGPARSDGDADRPSYEWVRDRAELPRDCDDGYQEVLNAAREAPVSSRSVDPAAYGDFMRTIFDEWVRNDVAEVSVRLFDQCLEIALRGAASLCLYRETCGDQVAMEHNGDVYACDHFVDPGFELGNIHETHLTEMLESDAQQQFGAYKRDGLPARCRACSVREFCHGGCPKNRHVQTPAGDPGLNYLCAGYRHFFSYVQPYLRIFERTVTENNPLPFVMDEIAVLDDAPVE